MAYIYDIADVWASSGTTFTAIKMSVTDTASAAGSLLMDLQVGGTSRFVVSKAGRVTLGSAATTGEFQFTEGVGVKVRLGSGSGTDTFAILGNVGISFKSSGGLFWSGAEDSFGSTDLQLRRDAANTLAQRNGVNAQAFNLYNTYTDASNYERGFMRFVSNVLEIGAAAAGTGTGRNISISPGGTGTQIVSVAMTGFQAFDLRYGGTPFINFQKYAGGGTTGWVTNASDIHYRWTPSGTALAEGDVGIKRDAAGVLKITNGNNAASGTGKLIFIVPTTDPGITGALWNNLGVLSISA